MCFITRSTVRVIQHKTYLQYVGSLTKHIFNMSALSQNSAHATQTHYRFLNVVISGKKKKPHFYSLDKWATCLTDKIRRD